MNRISNSKAILLFTKLMLLLAAAKVISLAFLWYLPSSGIEQHVKRSYEPKYYRYDFKSMLEKQSNGAKKESYSQDGTIISDAIGINDMILKGLYATGSKGYIIIAMKSSPKKTSIVELNELYEGYTLKSIELLSAIFEKEGKKFVLALEEIDSASMSSAPQTTADTTEVSSKDIVNYIKNPKSIWKDISIVEVKDGEKIVGFKVTKINPKSKFASLGLKKDDVIIKANNVALESYQDAINIYKDIDNISTLQIVVLRDNQEKELLYEIN